MTHQRQDLPSTKPSSREWATTRNRTTMPIRPWIAAAAALLFTGTVSTAQAADRYVDDTGGVNAVGCTSSGSPCLTINYALSQSVAGDTIHIAAGSYNEGVVVGLNGITLQGAGAGTNPLTHTVLDGNTPSPVVGPGPGFAPLSGIRVLNGITDVTILDLRVQDYQGNSGIFATAGNNGFTVQRVDVVGNNTSALGNNGGIYMNGPVEDVLINEVLAEGNRARGIVIWNGLKKNITITNCTVRNNNCCGIELQDGTATGVTMSGNLIEDQADSGMAAIGLTSGGGANVISDNVLSDNGRYGIEIKWPNGTGLETGDGSIVVRDNYVERTFVPAEARDLAGISVYRRSWVSGYADIPNGVVIKENTVQGYQQTSTSDGFGIVVEGTNMVVTNNTLTGNDVGVQIQQGFDPASYHPNAVGDSNQANLVDTYFGRGNTPTSSGTIRYNDVSANTVGIRNVSVAAASASQTCNWWSDESGPTDASNPGGTGAARSGVGAFAPWLVYGTDADAGTEGFQLPTSFSVTPSGAPNAADNDFTRLANAVHCAADGQTISLAGSFDWTEANALARWARGIDDVALTDDDYWIQMPANVDGVTLTAASLGAATITGPGDLPTVNLEGFIGAYDGGTHQNWTISNLEVEDFDLSIGLFCCGSGATSSQYQGTTIDGNRLLIATDLNATVAPLDVNQNIGIHLATGQNQTISNNLLDIAGDGVSDSGALKYSTSVGLQSNTHGGTSYDGLVIQNNTITVLGDPAPDPQIVLGIWENGHAHVSDVTVSNNDFVNLGALNDPALNLQRAFRVTSHSGALTTVTYSGNSVSGANLGFQWIAGSNFAAEQPVEFFGNEIDDVATGVLLQSNGKANATFNRITNAGVAVDVQGGSVADLECNVLQANATAVSAPSSGVSAGLNNLSGNDVAIDVVTDTGSGTSIFSATNRIVANAVNGARNVTPYAIDASGNWWGCAAGPGGGGCDTTSGSFDASAPLAADPGDSDADGFIDGSCDPDSDDDGLVDASDNCPTVPNPGQEDEDVDSFGDLCDTCTDSDGDGDGDPGFPLNTCADDNCPAVVNAGQEDADLDGIGDACDLCTDGDSDGFGDPGFPVNTCALDNCPAVANPGQPDADGDTTGDACDACTDTDGDAFGDPGFPANTCTTDNCPDDANPSQSDADLDDVGDVCDASTSPASLVLSSVRLRIDGTTTPNTGYARLTALINDNDTAGDLPVQLLGNAVSIRIRDMGDFDATIPLTSCAEDTRSGRISCSAGRELNASFRPSLQGPWLYDVKLVALKLSTGQTGSVAPSGPVTVQLHQGVVVRGDDITDCDVMASSKLTCIER